MTAPDSTPQRRLVEAGESVCSHVCGTHGTLSHSRLEYSFQLRLRDLAAALAAIPQGEPTEVEVEALARELCDTDARLAHDRGDLVSAQYDWEFCESRLGGDKRWRGLARHVLRRERGLT